MARVTGVAVDELAPLEDERGFTQRRYTAMN
jgi:hypothetical protein